MKSELLMNTNAKISIQRTVIQKPHDDTIHTTGPICNCIMLAFDVPKDMRKRLKVHSPTDDDGNLAFLNVLQVGMISLKNERLTPQVIRELLDTVI